VAADVTTGVAVLFAMEREAAPFRRAVGDRPGVQVVVTGIGPAAARRTAEAVMRREPVTRVVFAGFCGALRSGLAVGDVVVAAEVMDERGGRWACTEVGQGRTRLLTTDRLIGTTEAKRALGERHAADAVDMESAAVAAVCHARGVPFLAVRAVSDTVDTTLSPRLVKLLSGGSVSAVRAVLALARQPSLVTDFHRLARDTRLAAKQLAEALLRIVVPTP
jgi:adenosylhomocysteine nucleosidase